MKKKIIGIDIDSVIADSINLFLPYLNKRFNKDLCLQDIVHYEFEKCYNVTAEEVNEAFKDLTKNREWGTITPIKYANEFLIELSKNFTVVIVTSRPEKHMRNITEEWLKKHSFVYDDLLFMENEDGDKYMTGKKNNYEFDFFIEDCLEFALQILNYNIPVIIYDYPWNQCDNEKLIRVKDLRAALDAIYIIVNNKNN